MAKVNTLSHPAIVRALVQHGTRRDHAHLYADAFVQYREAIDHIARFGAIVNHPRTGNPIVNPYLEIRDKATAQLKSLHRIKADFLWTPTNLHLQPPSPEPAATEPAAEPAATQPR
jgi:hypothetical protein